MVGTAGQETLIWVAVKMSLTGGLAIVGGDGAALVVNTRVELVKPRPQMLTGVTRRV